MLTVLTKSPIVGAVELTEGDILRWGNGLHWAIYLGNGDIMEVSEWGADHRIIPLDKMLELEDMDPPDTVYSTQIRSI